MPLFEALQRSGQLRKHARRVATAHVLMELSVMPLLCGLHTGALTGFRPGDVAMNSSSASERAYLGDKRLDADAAQ